MGYLDELFGPEEDDEREEERRREAYAAASGFPDVGAMLGNQPSPYTSPRPEGTSPRPPLDIPRLPYGPGRPGAALAAPTPEMQFSLSEAEGRPPPGYRRPAPLAPGGMPPGAGGALGAPTPSMRFDLEEAEQLPADMAFSEREAAAESGRALDDPRRPWTEPEPSLAMPRLPYRRGEATAGEFTYERGAPPSPPMARRDLPAFDVTAGRFVDGPRPPLDMAFLPYEGEEPPERMAALRAAGEPAPVELPAFDVAAGRFEDESGGSARAGSGIERVFQQARGAKPGQPVSSLGPKPDELGDAIDEANRMRSRRQIGGGIARLFGMDRDVLQRSLDEADRPIEEYSLREGQRRYGAQQDAARREEAREAGREQRLGQERTRQLDLEERRLQQQATDAAATREQRAAAQRALEEYRARNLDIRQQVADQRGRRGRGGGGGGAGPGAAVDAAWVADMTIEPPLEIRQWARRDREIAAALQTPEGRAEVARNYGRLSRHQQGQLGIAPPGSQESVSDTEVDRYAQRQSELAGLQTQLADVETYMQGHGWDQPGADIEGVGGIEGWSPSNTDEQGRPTLMGTVLRSARQSMRTPAGIEMQTRLSNLYASFIHTDYGAQLTRTEVGRAIQRGLDTTATDDEIRAALGLLRRELAAEANRIRGGARPDIQETYERNLQVGGPRPGPPGASAPTGPTGPAGPGVLAPETPAAPAPSTEAAPPAAATVRIRITAPDGRTEEPPPMTPGEFSRRQVAAARRGWRVEVLR